MIGHGAERWVQAASASDRADALAFVARAARMNEAAVIRLQGRPDGRLGLWTHTGFDVLATRSIVGARRRPTSSATPNNCARCWRWPTPVPGSIPASRSQVPGRGAATGVRLRPRRRRARPVGGRTRPQWSQAGPYRGQRARARDRAARPGRPRGFSTRRTTAGGYHPAIGLRADRHGIHP